MELCTGGDLLELIQKRPGALLSEAESRHVFTSVARAVKQCHASSIVHRDIKPENILLCPIQKANASSAAAVAAASDDVSFAYTAKLADFGLAVDVPWWQQIRGYAGSKPYEAPEVMAGVAGGKRVLDEKVDFASNDWKKVSGDAKDLIRRMLRVDVNERFTIDKVLAHPWVRPAVAAAAQEVMETVDLSEKRTAAVVSHTDAQITPGIAEADSESTATSAAIFASEAKSTVSTVFKTNATTHVPDTKRFDTAGSMSLASATNSTDSDCGSNAEKPRWAGKLSPRTVLHRVMKAFSPLTRQKEASCIPIEVL
ncbi:unnamed protein product [Closterium sp. NIES-64]|nr:unnamed protein product [Closterium sp. NIES-64]